MSRQDDDPEVADVLGFSHERRKPGVQKTTSDSESGPPTATPGVDVYHLQSPLPHQKINPSDETDSPAQPNPKPLPGRIVPPPSVELIPSPVDQPWSRWQEWGMSLVRLAIAAVVTFFLARTAAVNGYALTAFLISAAGMVSLVLLSYPILITLERPVRMTPEQAINDYFQALSQHMPQYRRMWALLSSAGRRTPEFETYSEFRRYWDQRLAALSGGTSSWFNPLMLRIERFGAPVSAGKQVIQASFVVHGHYRSSQGGEATFSDTRKITLSRGPDRMWYLDDGRLPSKNVDPTASQT